MIPGGKNRPWQAIEQRVILLKCNAAGLAVHQLACAYDFPAERFRDRLVSEAHAENRHPAAEHPHRVHGYPGGARVSRSR